VDTTLGCCDSFFTPPHTSGRPEGAFYLCPSRKRNLTCSIMTLEKLKRGGGWRHLGFTSKDLFTKAFVLYSRGYKKWNFAEKMFETSAVFNDSLEDCFCFLSIVVVIEGCYVTPFFKSRLFIR
jgi:hypothetical protein